LSSSRRKSSPSVAATRDDARRRRHRRTTSTTVGDAHVARAAYFARVDAVTLAVDEDDDEDEEDRGVGTPTTPSGRRRRRRRCDDDDDDAVSLETLPPVFPNLTDAVVRAVRLAKATPKASDPVAAIRAVARVGRARRLAAAAKAAQAAATAIVTATPTVARDPVETNAFDAGAFDDVDAMETDRSPARDAETRTNEATEEEDDGVYGFLARAARAERATSLPSTYALHEVRASDPTCDDLVKLSLEFAREDPRVGSLAGGLGAAVAHVLRDDLGVAVGYTLTHENRAPEWDLSRAVALPPRLAHVFITRERRASGLGTALVDWWRRRFALRCAFFAVDAPNDAIARALRRIECSLATTRSGHDASSVHYVVPNARSP